MLFRRLGYRRTRIGEDRGALLRAACVGRSAKAQAASVMVSGDHPDTAKAIAKKLGIVERGANDSADVVGQTESAVGAGAEEGGAQSWR